VIRLVSLLNHIVTVAPSAALSNSCACDDLKPTIEIHQPFRIFARSAPFGAASVALSLRSDGKAQARPKCSEEVPS